MSPTTARPRGRPRANPATGSEPKQAARDMAPSGVSGSTSDSSDSPAPKKRTPTNRVLEKKVQQTYNFVGLSITPLGRFVPILGSLGPAMRKYSDEVANAWMELAEDDPKVMKIVKNMTSASAWGGVLGAHAAIFAEAIPGGQGRIVQETARSVSRAQTLAQEMEAAERAREAMQNMPARNPGTGGPGDTVRVPQSPSFQGQGEASEPIPTPSQSAMVVGTPKRSAIPTPEQMGVQTVGTEQGQQNYSAAPPPNGRQVQG